MHLTRTEDRRWQIEDRVEKAKAQCRRSPSLPSGLWVNGRAWPPDAPRRGLSHSHSLPFDGRPGGPSLPIELWLNDDCERRCAQERTNLESHQSIVTFSLAMLSPSEGRASRACAAPRDRPARPQFHGRSVYPLEAICLIHTLRCTRGPSETKLPLSPIDRVGFAPTPILHLRSSR